MAADRTFVTEVATGLGMLGSGPDPVADDALAEVVEAVLAARPATMANLGPDEWDRLARLWSDGSLRADFAHGVANGRAFLAAADALNGRPPRIVEWTGPRRAPGDEVVPADLRVDHVYLVSCKYLSKVLHNASPARLVDGHLSQGVAGDPGDWYQAVAPAEVGTLYDCCVDLLPPQERAPLERLAAPARRTLAKALAAGWPDGAAEAYSALCRTVAEATADRWADGLDRRALEPMLWRLLRIGSAPYFVLGTSTAGPMRLRIDTPWDWRQRFRLRGFEVEAQPGGQPRVGWRGRYQVLATGEERTVEGHVELRWSHGRFSGPPEAKVYLDTPHDEVPGYHPLEPTSGETPTPPTPPAPRQGDEAPRLFDA